MKKGKFMGDLQKTLKYSLVFGLSGAVIIPFVYEFYANVSKAVGIVLIMLWALTAGLKLSKQKISYCILGTTACLGYAGVLGIVCYVVIHKLAIAFMDVNGGYTLLPLSEQAKFVLYTAIIGMSIYIVCFFARAVKKALAIIIRNRENTASYIQDAFADENIGEKWL